MIGRRSWSLQLVKQRAIGYEAHTMSMPRGTKHAIAMIIRAAQSTSTHIIHSVRLNWQNIKRRLLMMSKGERRTVLVSSPRLMIGVRQANFAS